MKGVQNKDKKGQNAAGGSGATAPPASVAMASITMATSDAPLGESRGVCWTLFNYEQHVDQLREYAKSCRYMVFGYEVCPDTGRKHLQGYHYTERQRSLRAFSKKFGNCHVAAQRGTAKQASDYCKEDGKFEEFGELPQQGKRADWDKALEDLKTKDVIDVLEDQPHLIPCQRQLREIKNMFLKPKHRDVEVIVIYGDAGTGKTRYAYDTYTDIYAKPPGQWWDGYSGQKVVLMDDFYGWVQYHDLLHILDRYPYNAPYKGGYVWAQWDTVIITSNKKPSEWYGQGMTPALRRRLKKVFKYKSIDGVSEVTEDPAYAQASCSAATPPCDAP